MIMTNKRELKLGTLIYILSMFMGIFQLYTSIFRFMAPIPLQNLHIMLAYSLIFLIAIDKAVKAGSSVLIKAWYCLLLVLSLSATAYIQFNYDALVARVGAATTTDLIIGALLILVTLEATRSSFGIAIPLLTIVSIAYMFVGPYLPGILYHGGFSLNRVISTLTISFGGMYGTLLNTSATFLALFMIFGGLLGKSGASKFFMDLALAVGGKFRAGPALAAVISSCLMGTINGSAVANVATTGVFTIPMMKERGYEPHFAGAVEAAASTGGMLMPPVMGVGAFIMAELTGIPYAKIAGAALIPALMYYTLIGSCVILHSRKLGLKAVTSSEIPSLRTTLKTGVFHLIPLIAIVYCMVRGYSVTKAALTGISCQIAISIIVILANHSKSILSLKTWAPLADGLVDGIKSIIGVAATLACVGLMVDCIVCTGLAHRLVGVVLVIGENNQFLSLLITMLIALVFGMGVPTTASYIILATMAAPALVQAGLPLLAVHLFIYYFTIIGAVTPPVGNAAIVASRMAGADYTKTCLYAVKLSFSAFVLPFVFAFRPELLAQGSFLPVFEVSMTATIGLIALSMFFERMVLVRTTNLEQFILFVVAAILVFPAPTLVSVVALVLAIGILVSQKRKFDHLCSE